MIRTAFAGGAIALLFLTLIALTAAPALAQDAAIVITEPTLFDQIMPAVLSLAGVILTALLTWLAAVVKERFGLDIEARHREALQSALMNGILFALQKWSGWPIDEKQVLATARDYVQQSVPDALRQFGINVATRDGVAILDRLLTPHLPLPVGIELPAAPAAAETPSRRADRKSPNIGSGGNPNPRPRR